MQYKQLINLFFDFKNKSNNFAEIKYDLFIENPNYLYIFKYLFGQSIEDYAKIFSTTSDELTKLIERKKIDSKQAEKFQEIINGHLMEMEIREMETKDIKPRDYLEKIIDNFIKEEGTDAIIFKVKVDKIVSSVYYSSLMIILFVFVYFAFAALLAPVPGIFPYKNILVYLLIIFFVVFLVMSYLYRKYQLGSASRLIFVAHIIQSHLAQENLKLMPFVKEYLLYISNKMYVSNRIKEVNSLLSEIDTIFSSFNDFIKKRVINQLNKGNFSEVSLVLKNIGLQKMNGCLENYIFIKNYLKELESKFEIQPYKKLSKYEVTLQYSNILISNLFGILLNIKSIFLEIIPFLFIASILTYGYYMITRDLTNSAVIFTGICALLAVVYNKRK